MHRQTYGVAFCLGLASLATAAEPAFEGSVTASLVRGETNKSSLVWTRQDARLRIENVTNKIEPVNVLDLAANRLTIIYPHNSSFLTVDLAKLDSAGDPRMPPMPSANQTPPAKSGPNISPPPGFSAPPQMPPRPSPNAALGTPNMPNMPSNPMLNAMGMPQMPPMPGRFGPMELKKTEQTKKIQGFDCALYTIEDRGEKFEIWATSDAALFPFRLTERDAIGRRFGPQMLEEQWIEMLRRKSLFPMEATLRMTDGPKIEQLSFKVEKIEKKKIENDTLFKAPENYQEISAPF